MPACTIVCLGDSITRGLISANFVDLLDSRLGAPARGARCFINAGVNGDLAYNVLHRLERVITLQPRCVILMIGTNDVIATLRRSNLWISRISKWLPHSPTLPWFRQNLEEIVRRLTAGTSARLALASLPIIGEHLESVPNQRLRTYNAEIQEIAARYGLAYLPVYERMAEYLKSTGQHAGKPHHSRLFMTLELTVRHVFFKESYIAISRHEGFVLMTDGVHLNEQGAGLVAEVYQNYLTNSGLEVAG